MAVWYLHTTLACPTGSTAETLNVAHTRGWVIAPALPSVPVRQWVLSFPWPIRFLLSTRPEAVTGVLAIVMREIESSLIRRADLTRNSGARGGVVTLIQRIGGAANLNLHLPMVTLDMVYTKDGDTLRFHEVSAPSSHVLALARQPWRRRRASMLNLDDRLHVRTRSSALHIRPWHHPPQSGIV